MAGIVVDELLCWAIREGYEMVCWVNGDVTMPKMTTAAPDET